MFLVLKPQSTKEILRIFSAEVGIITVEPALANINKNKLLSVIEKKRAD